MFKLLFLLVLTLVAAMQNDNNGSQPQTNVTGEERQAPAPPPAISIVQRRTLFLISLSDMDMLGPNQFGVNQIVICQRVSILVDPRDNICHCATHTARRDVAYCNNEVKPTVQKLTEKDSNTNEMRDVPCGPKGRQGSMFRFGYQACDVTAHINTMPIPLPLPIEENSDFFEVFKFCRREKDSRVIYTEHVIHNPEYLTRDSLEIQQRHDEKYNMMTNGYELFGSQYETVAEAYQKLSHDNAWKVVGAIWDQETPSELPKELFSSMVKAQQLVPVDDMAFTMTRRPTYHYLNIAAMRESQIFLWNYISYLIRTDARENNRLFTINTGAFIINPRKKDEKTERTSEEGDKEEKPETAIKEGDKEEKTETAIEEGDEEEKTETAIEEGDEEESTETAIEEADIWIKMVRYEKPAETSEEKGQMESFAIVMNTGLDEKEFKEFNDELCGNNLCEKAFSTYKTFSGTHQLVRCCPTKKIAEKFFDKKLGTESSFKIEAFTEAETMSQEEEKEYFHKILSFFPKLM